MDTTTATATLADELRTAAARLRDAAKKATPGPWTAEHRSWAGPNAVLSYALNGHAVAVCGEEFKGADHPASADAAWIALASPVMAEPLAAWLEEVATQYDAPSCDHPDGVCNGCERRDDFVSALHVAQIINGGAA